MKNRHFLLAGVAACLVAIQAQAGVIPSDNGCSLACRRNVVAVFAAKPHHRLTVRSSDRGSVVYMTWSANQHDRWTASPVTYKGTVPFPLFKSAVLKDANVPSSPGEACHAEIVLEQGRGKAARRYRIEMRNVLCSS